MADSWEYKTISTNSANLATSLAKFQIARKLADQLQDDGVIGDSTRDLAYVTGPDVTERMRVRPIIDAMKEKIKLKKAYYCQFRTALQAVLGADADAIETYVPAAPGNEFGDVEPKLQESQHQSLLSKYPFSSLSNKWIRAVLVLLLLLVLVLLLLLVLSLLALLYQNLLPKPESLHISKSLPYPTHIFVGRDEDMKVVMQQLHFTKPNSRIVNIAGPPGFGKSTLAIHIGHRMLVDGVLVHYVDMREISSMRSLAEKILDSNDNAITTIDHLYKWAKQIYQNRTLLILDNCDDMLQNQTGYHELQKVVIKLLEGSTKLRILVTSRLRMLLLPNQFTHSLHNLSSEESCELLQKIISSHNATILDSNTCITIADLTGNAPLALQVVGAVLNQPDPPEPLAIVANLKKDPISTTSTGELRVEYRVNASIRLSYDHLTSSLQIIGRYLAEFPGSFDEEAACTITSDVFNSSACSGADGFHSLVDRSLLRYDHYTKRYQFHRLIQDFFLQLQISPEQFKSTIMYFTVYHLSHYEHRLRSYADTFPSRPAEVLLKFDAERHNFLQLFSYIIKASENTPPELEAYHKVTMRLMNCFVKSHRLLELRFTPKETSVFHQSIINYIARNWRTLYELADYRQMMISTYVDSTIELGNFRAKSYNISHALNVVSSQQHVLEAIYSLHPTGVIYEYIEFYYHLKSYYSRLEQHENASACLQKISQKLKVYQLEPYDYPMIGLSYFDSEDYESSIPFFALFLEQNEDLFLNVSIKSRLWIAYRKLHRMHDADLIAEDLLQYVPFLLAVPDVEFFPHLGILPEILPIYEMIGKESALLKKGLAAAAALYNVMVQGQQKLPSELASILYSLVATGRLYSHGELRGGNYTEAVVIAQLAVGAVSYFEKLELSSQEIVAVPILIGQNIDHQWTDMLKGIEIAKLYLLLYIGEANYLVGNYSQGLGYFDQVINLMHEEQNVSIQLLSRVCSYAIYGGRTECIKFYLRQIGVQLLIVDSFAVMFKWLFDDSLIISLVQQMIIFYLCYRLWLFLKTRVMEVIMYCAYTVFLYLYSYI